MAILYLLRPTVTKKTFFPNICKTTEEEKHINDASTSALSLTALLRVVR